MKPLTQADLKPQERFRRLPGKDTDEGMRLQTGEEGLHEDRRGEPAYQRCGEAGGFL